MVWKFMRKVGKSVAEAAKFVSPNVDYSLNIPKESALVKRQEEITTKELQLGLIQDKNSSNFESKIEVLKSKKNPAISDFIGEIETAIQQNNLEFDRWCLEIEKKLQLELLTLKHQLQKELILYQRESSLKVIEEQKRLENSPIWLVAADIISSYSATEMMPLRVFFAPPKLQFERFASAANAVKSFPDIELTVAEGLRQFFREYSSKGRDIDFLAGAWVSKSFHSEASIKSLFAVLKSQPTLVLESEVDGNYLNFRIAYWGFNWSKYRYDSAISRLPYRDVLYESAKVRARRWLTVKNKLVAAGETAETVDKVYGGDNLKNLQTLQKEQKFKKAGVAAKDLNLNYVVNREDFEELGKFFTVYHCLFAGLVADEYFLIEYNLPPLLPELLPNLMANISDSAAVNQVMQAVVFYYQKLYVSLETKRSGWMPELALDLALSLAHLPNKTWARSQVKNSAKIWLKRRGISPQDNFLAVLEAVESTLIIEDLEYVEKLNRCLAAIGETRRLNVTDACYKRGMLRFKQNNYRGAIADFDRALALNPELAEAYYYRAFAFGKLEEYQLAIDNLDRALKIKPLWPEAYNNRGNIYYKLKEYEKAIADYQRSLSIEPQFDRPRRNIEIARGALEELKRRQQEEKRRKGQLEKFRANKTIKAHLNTIRGIAIAPDGKTLATASYDETIKLWNLKTGKELQKLTEHSQDVECLAISADSKILASGSDDNTIKLWNLPTGKEFKTLAGHSGWVRCLTMTADGKTLVSGSDDKTIALWNLETGEKLQTMEGHESGVYAVAIAPDGRLLASGSNDSTIKLWNLETGKEMGTLTGHADSVWCLAFSPDGEKLVSVSGDNKIKVWQSANGKELYNLEGIGQKVLCVAIAPDGKRFVSGNNDGSIEVWQLESGQKLGTLTGHKDIVWSVAIAPDGETLVSGSEDRSLKVWRA